MNWTDPQIDWDEYYRRAEENLASIRNIDPDRYARMSEDELQEEEMRVGIMLYRQMKAEKKMRDEA